LPFAPDAFRLEEMKKYDPEMYELEVRDRELESQTQTLAQQLRRAPLNERAELKKQLQELVDQHFDARQTRRELQLKRLEAELEQMRASLTKRQEVREQIVGRRIAELTGDEHDFDF
jgi:hypothetical protein